MISLILKFNGENIQQVTAGGWVSLPDGRKVSPAYAGWDSGDGYSLVEAPAPLPPAEPTPEEIRAAMPDLTKRQLKLGLLLNGISTAAVSAVIEAMPEGVDKSIARIEWEDATSYSRTHPLIASVSAALGLTPEQIDQMWTSAAAL